MIYQTMSQKSDLLERLDITVQWGHYEIVVLRFHLTSFPAGKIIDFHNHAEFEFHFIPKGKGKVILAEQEYPLSQGMLYLTGPGVMHYQEADQEEAMDELCLHIDIRQKSRAEVDPWEVAEAEECIDKLRKLPLIPIHDRHHAMNCFLEAYEACEDKFTGYYTAIKQFVISILLKTARAYDPEGVRAEAPVRDMLTYRYEYAIQYIRANYSGAVTLDNVAEKLKISSRQLQRIFNKVNPDQSFSQILENIRLEGVCRKLSEGNQPIEQIAQSEGFTNANYLHIVFRKRLGITPATYRNGKHTIK
ncbi:MULTISPECIES: AraC family transcriptional regulator [Paenibacillus]|uniref:AraC family transcriptional regulator n=1 Tax=Paenibacillus borealis TaxID=160799 RepID=A0ABX3HD15_PAEBO|nr:helix-turn-helix domain-containing protein [Paenibacillus borealis]OMD48384.1 AraC family transcriptional regulator [Paenibacillus borealis]